MNIIQKLDQWYEEWSGTSHLVNSNKLVHDSAEAQDFARYCIDEYIGNHRKEYCKCCGQELVEIRGKYPKEPKRKVCPCCVVEKLEWIKEQIHDIKYNNASENAG